MRLYEFDPNIRLAPGSRGNSVRRYQDYLVKLGYNIKVDGIYGSATTNAVKQFQQKNNLTADGILGPNTAKSIESKLAIATSISTSTNTSSMSKSLEDKPIKRVVRAGSGFTDVETQDGEIQRRKGTRAWRNNNPGNIEYSSFAQRMGAVGTDGRFAVFPTSRDGFDAKRELLFGPTSKYKDLSITAAMNRYAPSPENDTKKYISTIVKATGATENALLSQLTAQQQDAMLQAITQFEGYKVGEIINSPKIVNPVT